MRRSPLRATTLSREETYDEFVCDFGSDESEDEVEHDWKVLVEIAFGGGVVARQSHQQEWNDGSQYTGALKVKNFSTPIF